MGAGFFQIRQRFKDMLTFRTADYTTVVKFYNWTVAHTAWKEVSVLSVQPTFPTVSLLHPETFNPNDFPAPRLNGVPRVCQVFIHGQGGVYSPSGLLRRFSYPAVDHRTNPVKRSLIGKTHA